MRRILIVASVLTMFVAAGLAPVAQADGNETDEDRRGKGPRDARDQDRDDDRRGAKEDKRELKDDRKEFREKHPMRFQKANATLALSGTAEGKDNATYTFELTATGAGVERFKAKRDADANATGNVSGIRFHARLAAHIVVKDANGTVVKEGDLRVQLFARSHGNETKWILGSVAKRDDGMPRLVLKGDAEKVSVGAFELEGKGRGVVKADGERGTTPLKIAVSGTFSRSLPPAAA